MNKRQKIFSVIGLLGLNLLQSAFAEQKVDTAPVIDDFAYTSILSDAKTSLRQLDLPLDIYTKMYRRDYGDLRIFSADGQVVPHQFTKEENRDKTDVENLVFYPFTKAEANDSRHTSIEVNQDTGKQQIKINQSVDNVNNENQKIEYQYIIENSVNSSKIKEEQSSLCGLKLSWEQSKPSLILPLTLEISSDLQQWRSVSRDLNISRLSYDKSQLIRDEIEFACTTAPFLRLTWLNQKITSEASIHLTDVMGFYTRKDKKKPLWKSFGKPQYAEDGHWYFESDVVAPLLKMAFIPPQDGLLFKGTLYSRTNPNGEWIYRQNITQYRLNLGEGDLQSHPFSLANVGDKYWKFIPLTETRFNEDQLPEIKATWRTNKVLFLAQGAAPFRLAFGNPKISQTENHSLRQLVNTIQSTGAIIDAVKVSNIMDKGKIFEDEVAPNDKKKIFFWVILSLGTLLMAFMAFRLLQQMNK